VSKHRNRLYGVLLVILVSVLCIGTLELLLRRFVFDPNASFIRTPGWSLSVRTNGEFPMEKVPEDHTIIINRIGLRGALPEFGANPKIAVFGGSTVEDFALSERNTWPQQLALNLSDCAPKVWVANLGKSGVNARHHLLQLPEVEKYMPKFDMFVVLMGLNDFLYDLHIHHPVETPDGWWQKQAFQSRPGDEGSFALKAIFHRLKNQYISDRNAAATVNISDFGNYMKMLRDARTKITNDQKVENLPDLKEYLERYRGTIRSLKSQADSYQVPIIFVTQPFVWSENMTEEAKAQIYSGFIGEQSIGVLDSPSTKWFTPSAMEKGLSAYNATLLDMCKLERLICVDAASVVRDASYFYDDFHFSKNGAAKVGSTVANAICPIID